MTKTLTRVLLTAFALVAGCSDSTRPDVDPRSVAGTYVLETVTGRGPATGVFLVTAEGRAERRVQYASRGSNPAVELVSPGTFRLHADGTIDFALADGGRTWNVRGAFAGERFTLTSADPADGPNIVETYRRQ